MKLNRKNMNRILSGILSMTILLSSTGSLVSGAFAADVATPTDLLPLEQPVEIEQISEEAEIIVDPAVWEGAEEAQQPDADEAEVSADQPVAEGEVPQAEGDAQTEDAEAGSRAIDYGKDLTASPVFTAGYVSIRNRAELYDGAGSAAELKATLGKGVVYATERTEHGKDRLKVLVNDGATLFSGWVNASELYPMDEDAVKDFIESCNLRQDMLSSGSHPLIAIEVIYAVNEEASVEEETAEEETVEEEAAEELTEEEIIEEATVEEETVEEAAEELIEEEPAEEPAEEEITEEAVIEEETVEEEPAEELIEEEAAEESAEEEITEEAVIEEETVEEPVEEKITEEAVVEEETVEEEAAEESAEEEITEEVAVEEEIVEEEAVKELIEEEITEEAAIEEELIEAASAEEVTEEEIMEEEPVEEIPVEEELIEAQSLVEELTEEEIPEEEISEEETAEDLITEQPEDYNGALGDTAFFTVESSTDVTYQWQRKPIEAGEEAWENITEDHIALGWNTDTLRVLITLESAQYLYRCHVEEVEQQRETGELVSLFRHLFFVSEAFADGEGGSNSEPASINVKQNTEGSGTIDTVTSGAGIIYIWHADNMNHYQFGKETAATIYDTVNNIVITSDNNTDEKHFIIGEDNQHHIYSDEMTVYFQSASATAAGSSVTVKTDTTLIITGTCGLPAITVESGKTLTLQSNENNLTVTSIGGSGSVIFSGSGTTDVSGDVAVGGNLTMNSSMTVKAANFGIRATDGKVHTITDVSGANLNNINTFGALNNTCIVRMYGNPGFDKVTTKVLDYPLTWTTPNDVTAQTNQEILAGYYRKSNAAFVGGFIPAEGNTYTFDANWKIPGADAAAGQKPVKPYYTFMGWNVVGEPLADPSAFTGINLNTKAAALTLEPVFAPYRARIEIRMNDGTDAVYTTVENITLTDNTVKPLAQDVSVNLYSGQNQSAQTTVIDQPQRIGYTFGGYALSANPVNTDATYGVADAPNEHNYASYTVALDENDTCDAGGVYTKVLYCVWKPISISIFLYMDTEPDDQYVTAHIRNNDIAINANSQYWNYVSESGTSRLQLKTELNINYGESISDYLARIGENALFPLTDTRTAATDTNDLIGSKDFEQWVQFNKNELTVDNTSSATLYDAVNNPRGLIVKDGPYVDVDMTDAVAVNDALERNGLYLKASWVNMRQTLKIHTDDPDWTILVDDVAVTPVNGELSVPALSKITFAMPKSAVSSETIAYWSFYTTGRAVGKNDIASAYPELGTDGAFWPVERVTGGDTLYYDFWMPYENVAASHVGARNWLTDAGDYSFSNVVPAGNIANGDFATRLASTGFGFTLSNTAVCTINANGERTLLTGYKAVTAFENSANTVNARNAGSPVFRWPTTTFSFTSNQSTSNQIRVDRAMTLNLNDVRLGSRNGASSALTNDDYFFDVTLKRENEPNIVFGNTADDYFANPTTTDGYTVTINCSGTNEVYLISSSQILAKGSNHTQAVQVKINNGSLALSNLITNGSITVTDTNISDINGASGFMLMFPNGTYYHTGGKLVTTRTIRSAYGFNSSADYNNRQRFYVCGNSGGIKLDKLTQVRVGQLHSSNSIALNYCNDIVASYITSEYGYVSATDSNIKCGFMGFVRSCYTSGTLEGYNITKLVGNTTVEVSSAYRTYDLKGGYYASVLKNADSGFTRNNTVGLRLGALYMYNASTGSPSLTVKDGLDFEIFNSMIVKDPGTVLNVSGELKAQTITKNSTSNGVTVIRDGLYVYSDESRLFHLEVLNGAHASFGGLNGGQPFGDGTRDITHVTVAGTGSLLHFSGNVNLRDRVEVSNGGSLTVSGNLTVQKDLVIGGNYSHTELSNAATRSTITGTSGGTVTASNIYHSGNAKTTYNYSLDRYYTIRVENGSTVTANVIGSATAEDRTDVAYDRANTHFQANTVNRDILLRWSVGADYTNANAAAENIRLVNDVCQDSTVVLVKPELKADSNAEAFEDNNCWSLSFNDDKNSAEVQVNGWNNGDTGFYTDRDGAVNTAASFAGDSDLPAVQIAVLTAKTLFTKLYVPQEDAGVITEVACSTDHGATWTVIPRTAGTPDYFNVNTGSLVRVTTNADYSERVVATGKQGARDVPLTVTDAANGKSFTFDLTGSTAANLYVTNELRVYLDLSDIVAGIENNRWGFWLSQDRSQDFYRYGGHLIVTQSDAQATSEFTLLVTEDNTASDALRITVEGVTVPVNANVSTVIFNENGLLTFSGTSKIRNLVMADGSSLQINATGAYVYSQVAAAMSTTIHVFIGHEGSAKSSLTIKGGTWYLPTTLTSGSNETVFFGFMSKNTNACDVTLDGLHIIGQSTNGTTLGTSSSALVGARKGCIDIKDCTMNSGTASNLTDGISYGNYSAIQANTINIINSDLSLKTYPHQDYADAWPFRDSTTQSAYTSDNSNPVSLNISNNSHVRISERKPDTYQTSAYQMQNTVTVSGNSELIVERPLLVNQLTVDAGSRVHICRDNNGFTLYAKTLNNAGTIVAGRVLTGGFAQNTSKTLNYMNGSSLTYADGTGTTLINNGTIRAIGGTLKETDGTKVITSGAIGGSSLATLVNNGIMEADVIGGVDYKVGFTIKGEYYIAEEDIKTGALSGTGTVNADVIRVTDLSLSNGTHVVNEAVEANNIALSSHASLTGNAAITALNGGTITVSDHASLQAASLTAPGGSILLSTDATTFTAPDLHHMQGETSLDPIEAGICVAGEIAAQNVSIQAPTRVFAGTRVVSDTEEGETGSLTVTAGTEICSENVGAAGLGNITVSISREANVHVIPLMTVNYNLNDDEADPAVNLPDNPPSFEYIAGSEEKVFLLPPTRSHTVQINNEDKEVSGYEFLGWAYDDEQQELLPDVQVIVDTDGSVREATQAEIDNETVTTVSAWYILKNRENNLHVIALWAKKQVRYMLYTDVQKSTLIYTDAKPARTVTYGEKLLDYLSTEGFQQNNKAANGLLYLSTKTQVSTDDRVTLEVIDEYETALANGGVGIELYTTMVPINAFVFLSLKDVTGHIPASATYATASAACSYTVNANGYVQAKIGVGDIIQNGAFGSIDSVKGLPIGVAEGYTFHGWDYVDPGRETHRVATWDNTTETMSYSAEWNAVSSYNTMAGDIYLNAVWEANTYPIIFDAGQGALATAEGVTYSDATGFTLNNGPVTPAQRVEYDITYDNIVDGNLKRQVFYHLPAAWKPGYVFTGWYHDNTLVTETTAMTWVPDEGEENVLLTASYRPAVVTLDLNGGTAAQALSIQTADTPLPGYVEDNGLYYIFTHDQAGCSATYPAEDIRPQDTESGADYRTWLGRNGYTLTGWEIVDAPEGSIWTNGTRLQTTHALYEDLRVRASWQANSYNLHLDSIRNVFGDVTVDEKTPHAMEITGMPVTVGQDIPAGILPDRGDWEAAYTVNSEQTVRILVGMTFRPDTKYEYSVGSDPYKALYPNVAVNGKYQNMLKDLTNAGLVLNNGSLFTVDRDYHNGETLTLYALYREKSVIFYEYFADANGARLNYITAAAQQQVGVYPYYNPATAGEYIPVAPEGYTFTGFYYGGTTPASKATLTADLYLTSTQALPASQENSYATFQAYITNAATSKLFDVYVYAVYRPKLTITNLRLTATAGKAASESNAVYQVPAAFATDVFKYKVTLLNSTGKEFKLDSTQSILTHGTQESWTTVNNTTGTPEDTFAVKMVIVDLDGKDMASEDLLAGEGWLDLNDENSNNIRCLLGAGYKIRFELTNAERLAEEYEFTYLQVEIYWTDNPTDATARENAQSLTFKVPISTEPAKYDLVYDSNLTAQNVGPLVLKNSSPLFDGENAYGDPTFTAEYVYGSELDQTGKYPKTMAVDGLTFTGWNTASDGTGTSYSDAGDPYTATGIKMDLYPEGNLGETVAGTLYAQWTRNDYELSVSQTGNTKVTDLWRIKTTALDGTTEAAFTGTEKDLPYYELVTLTLTGSGSNAYPEFIRISTAGTEEGNLLTVADVTAENNAETAYSFRMPAYDRELSFNRLATLDISAGDIVIDADGYTLNGGSKVTWRGDYRIIQSTQTTAHSLTVNALAQDAALTLADLTLTGHDSLKVNGNITLELDGNLTARNIQVEGSNSLILNGNSHTVTLNPYSGRAGIGGTQNRANGAVTVNNANLNITVPSGSSASAIGPGGGATSGNAITLNNVSFAPTVLASGSSYTGTLLGASGVSSVSLNTVTWNRNGETNNGIAFADGLNVSITDSDIDTMYKLRAHGNVTLTNSTVLLDPALDTYGSSLEVSGNIDVTGSTLTATKSNVYTGTLKIHDATASQVVLKDLRFLDVNNGNIVIGVNGITQGSTERTGTETVVLLDNVSGSHTADVTVSRPNCKVYAGSSLKLNSYSTAALGNTLVGTAGETLTLTGDVAAEHSLQLENLTVTGNGNITAADRLTLKNVTVNVNGNVGHTGSRDGDTVIVGSVNVTAHTLGALDSTFSRLVQETGATLTAHASVVRDWYRIAYEKGDMTDMENGSYPTAFRTTEATNGAMNFSTSEETMTVSALEDVSKFDCWYTMSTSDETDKTHLEKNAVDHTTVITAATLNAAHAEPDTSAPVIYTLKLYALPTTLALNREAWLTACDTNTDTTPSSFTFTFDRDNLALTVGEDLRLVSAVWTPATGTQTGLVAPDVIRGNESSMAAADANTKFAFEAKLGNYDAVNVQTAGENTSLGTVPAGEGSVDLTVRMLNAYAMTEEGAAGTLVLTFRTEKLESDQSSGSGGDELTVTLHVTRTRSQINASVPLVVVFRTNIDGGTAQMDGSAFRIENNSAMDLILTDVTVQDKGNGPLQMKETAVTAGDIDKYNINIKTDAEDTVIEPAQSYNPIDSVVVSPLDFVTKRSDGTNEYGVHFATVVFTVGIRQSAE